jgi:hypothetical protein
MATTNNVAAAAGGRCKMALVGRCFQVQAADLPVDLTIESDPAECGFTFAEIDVRDGNNKLVDTKRNINATTAKLPPTLNTLPAGTYGVFLVPSPAANGTPEDHFGEGTAKFRENCVGRTLLAEADATVPMPEICLEVK